jgi:hypothetical protein
MAVDSDDGVASGDGPEDLGKGAERYLRELVEAR